MADNSKKPGRVGSEMPHSPKPAEILGGQSRSDAKSVLAAGPDAPDPDRPPTHKELIDSLGMRSQYEERADHMVSLIHDGLFVFGEPIPSCERVMETFTKEMLELAATFQEPTLLLVPETSFAAKVRVLNATRTMDGQKDCYVDDIYKQSDSGSEMITGWKAVIVEGSREMKAKEGDNPGIDFVGRIKNRKAARRKNPDESDLERGMDRHTYAMLMLEALRKGEPIDQWGLRGDRYTLLDDDPGNSDDAVPNAFYSGSQVSIGMRIPGNPFAAACFRSSVGGDVKSA